MIWVAAGLQARKCPWNCSLFTMFALPNIAAHYSILGRVFLLAPHRPSYADTNVIGIENPKEPAKLYVTKALDSPVATRLV